MSRVPVFFRHRDGSRCRHPRAGRAPCPGGSWAYVVDLPAAFGRRRQRKAGGFPTRQAALEAMEAVKGSVKGGEPVATGTVGQFLAEWLVATAPAQRPSSRRAYQTSAGHLIDQIGHVRLADVSPAHVAAAQAALLDRGRRDGSGGLSPTTVRAWCCSARPSMLPWRGGACRGTRRGR